MNKKWRGFVVVVVVLTVSVVAGFAAWAGTGGEPALDCREVDGQEVCDTFGESDEGQGTTKPAGGAGDEPALDCRELDGQEVCDTFGESDEGPGTQ